MSYPYGLVYKHVNTNTTVVCKTGPGTLHGIVLNKAGATGNTMTVYDNTAGSGTVIAVIDGTVGAWHFQYDCDFATGLTVVVANGTAGDFTVVYA